jgi:phosphoglucosamine mutase
MKYFGTDGIRNSSGFFDENFLTAAAAGISILPHCYTVATARDTRPSGEYMEKTLAEKLSRFGVSVVSLGILPSPALALFCAKNRFDYGIMISASHNPPEYNGIKIFDDDGAKITENYEKIIEDYIDDPFYIPQKKAEISYADGRTPYIDFVKNTINADLSGMKILLDCAYGAASNFARTVFAAFGAETVTCFDAYLGEKINCACGAAHPETLKLLTTDYFDLSFCFDGDADRVMMTDGKKIYDGDHIMYIAAKRAFQENKLSKNTAVGTIMTNSGTENAYIRSGINFVRTDVGDRNVYLCMKENGYKIGGETSGHIIFGDSENTGDGIFTALKLCSIAKEYDIKKADDIEEYPSVSDCIATTPEKIELFVSDDRFRAFYKKTDGVRTVVRASGTEPKIRIMAESRDKKTAAEAVKKIKYAIAGLLGESI